MRDYQISIQLNMPDGQGGIKTLSVYADSNDIWEAVSAGHCELVDAIQSDVLTAPFPKFGYKSHQWRTPTKGDVKYV